MIFLNNLKIYVWMSDFMYLRDDVSYNSFMSDLIFIGRDWNIAAATTTTYYYYYYYYYRLPTYTPVLFIY